MYVLDEKYPRVITLVTSILFGSRAATAHAYARVRRACIVIRDLCNKGVQRKKKKKTKKLQALVDPKV